MAATPPSASARYSRVDPDELLCPVAFKRHPDRSIETGVGEAGHWGAVLCQDLHLIDPEVDAADVPIERAEQFRALCVSGQQGQIVLLEPGQQDKRMGRWWSPPR